MKQLLTAFTLGIALLTHMTAMAEPMPKEAPMTTSATAIFAGGCFWCMQPPFDNTEGVLHTEVGYTGGHVEKPTYRQVSSGTTGHYEAIRVTYDPARVSYQQLLDVFWHNIDPTDEIGQFADRGPQYQTAIFYADESQREQAEASKDALTATGKFDRPIVVKILPASTFYAGEEYHQEYYQKNSLHYKLYKKGSGREDFIKRNWEGQHP